MKFNSTLKKQLMHTAISGALIAGLVSAPMAFAVATFPTSGSCVMLVTHPVPYAATDGSTSDVAYNTLAILTFTSTTTGTISYYNSRVNYTAGGIEMVTTETASDVAFTIGNLEAPAPAAVKSIAFPAGEIPANQIIANAVSVNAGNTILIQGQNDAFSGVCQF